MTATLQPENIADMIAYAIGDAISWLIRWALLLLICLVRDVMAPATKILFIAFVWFLWGIGTAAIFVSRFLWLAVRLYVRLIVSAGTLAYRRWKHRNICRETSSGEEFITVPYSVSYA